MSAAPEIAAHGGIECWQCNGIGWIAGCFEDCCSCMGDLDDPDECCSPRPCGLCKGKGHFPQTAKGES